MVTSTSPMICGICYAVSNQWGIEHASYSVGTGTHTD